MQLRLILSLGLLGVLIYIISKSLNITDLQSVLWAFPKEQLVLFALISFLISLLKSWKFFLILKQNNVDLSFLSNLKAFLCSQALTPLPGGEMVRSFLIHKETGESVLKTTGPVFTQAFLEIFFSALVLIIGSFYFNAFRIPSTIVLVLMALVTYLIIHPRLLNQLLSYLPKNKWFEKMPERIQVIQKGIRNGLLDTDHKKIRPNPILLNLVGLSLMTNFLGGLLLLLIAQSYNADLNILQAIYIYSAGIVIQGVGTVSPGGLGFTEGGMTGLMLLFNIELSKALASVILFRIVTFFFSIILGLILMTIFYTKLLHPKYLLREAKA